MDWNLEVLFALLGTLLFILSFFNPDHRLVPAAGTALGVALLVAWL